MAMMMNDGSQNQDLMLELNTTPLIDVLLVLLVMLILTIPPVWHSVNMQLPGDAAPRSATTKVVQLDVLPMDHVVWNGISLDGPQVLEAYLKEAAAQNPAPLLHIRPQADVRYAGVASVMARAQRLGVHQIALGDSFK